MKWLLASIVALLPWLLSPLAARGQDPLPPLQGDFAVTIAPEDVPRDMIDGASLIGRWQITFAADGGYTLGRQDVGVVVTGAFTTTGDEVTLHDESGILACDPATDATYTWRTTENRLLLIAIDEPCARRRLLLTTRALSPYVPCPAPMPAAATPIATPVVAAATPVPPRAPTDADIDTLLGQLSDCWATRAPERFLPLLSREFQLALQPADQTDTRLALLMGAPLIWERVGNVDPIDATRARARVRQISGDEIDELLFDFVYEDGSWRWDGITDPPASTPVDVSS